jgi:DNA-binding beta-propeller fold protein YncE
LSVFNGATCNATDTSGCDQVPATMAFGDSGDEFADSTVNLAVNESTNTVYATNVDFGSGTWIGTSVYVIDGATCDATDTAGCSQPVATITPGNPSAPGGLLPWGVAVDAATDTVYVALQANGDYAATVAVINGTTCNGSDTSGCGQLPPTVPVGFGAALLAVDTATNSVYVANTEDASISVINGTTCNAVVSFGCRLVPPRLPAGNYPGQITLDPAVATGYVSDNEGVSVVPLAP